MSESVAQKPLSCLRIQRSDPACQHGEEGQAGNALPEGAESRLQKESENCSLNR